VAILQIFVFRIIPRGFRSLLSTSGAAAAAAALIFIVAFLSQYDGDWCVEGRPEARTSVRVKERTYKSLQQIQNWSQSQEQISTTFFDE
jgi:hypothetical protein